MSKRSAFIKVGWIVEKLIKKKWYPVISTASANKKDVLKRLVEQRRGYRLAEQRSTYRVDAVILRPRKIYVIRVDD